MDRQSANRGHQFDPVWLIPRTYRWFHRCHCCQRGTWSFRSFHHTPGEVANAEVAATHNQSPSTTPSVMRVDDPQKADEVFSVGVGQIGKFDLVAGAPKGRNPADAAPELPAHPVAVLAVGAMAGVPLQPKEALSAELSAELSGELLACIKAVKSDPAAWRYYQKQGTQSRHLEDPSKATPEEVQALTLVFDRTKKCYATLMAAAQKTGGADLAIAHSYEAFHAGAKVEAARLAKGEITWGVYNERCIERGTKSWEELRTRLAAIPAETKQAEASRLRQAATTLRP